jgi:diacylglycerol O-acyltransferase
MIVTKVPGPPMPFFLLGARLLECYPMIPLLGDQGGSIAILSYAGGLYWSLCADRDAIPDLHDLVGRIAAEVAALEEVACLAADPPARP